MSPWVLAGAILAAAAVGADWGTTVVALRLGAREVGPLARRIGPHWSALLSLVLVAVIAVAAGWPGWARCAILAVLGLLRLAIAARNAEVARHAARTT